MTPSRSRHDDDRLLRVARLLVPAGGPALAHELGVGAGVIDSCRSHAVLADLATPTVRRRGRGPDVSPDVIVQPA